MLNEQPFTSKVNKGSLSQEIKLGYITRHLKQIFEAGVQNTFVRTFIKSLFMPVKLNLSVNAETAKRIKHYAAKNKTTVSKIAEDQFEKLTQKPKIKGKSFADKYAGTLKHPIPDVDKAKDKYLKEKYGV